MSIQKLITIRQRLANLMKAEAAPPTATVPPVVVVRDSAQSTIGTAEGADESGQAARTTSESSQEGSKPLDGNANKEIKGIIQSVDELIADYKREWLIDSNMAQELRRTTGKPLEPPAKPGPHEIKWFGF